MFAALLAAQTEAVALVLVVHIAFALGKDSPPGLEFLGLSFSPQTVLLLAVMASAAAVVLHLSLARATATIGSNVLHAVRRRMIALYLGANWPTQAGFRDGTLQEMVTTLGYRASWLVQSSILGAAHIIALVTFFVVALIASPTTTAVALAIGLFVVILLSPISRRAEASSREYVQQDKSYAESVGELTHSSMELKQFGVEARVEDLLSEMASDVQRAQARTRFLAMAAQLLYKDVVVLFLTLAMLILTLSGRPVVSGMGAAITLCARALVEAQQANNSYQVFVTEKANLTHIEELCTYLTDQQEASGPVPLGRVEELEFVNVSYSYNDDNEGTADAVLTNVSFRLRRGESVALVGPSGSGKSTIAQLMLRLRKPTEGQILVNGIDYRDFCGSSWSANVSAVSQESMLLQDSVAANIAFFREFDASAIEDAAGMAHVGHDISNKVGGFSRALGPRGRGLSGGQKQRIAIARAMIGEPEILVMDEPSSALDSESEVRLAQTVNEIKSDRIVVVIAHRQRTIEACDRVLRVVGGTLVELQRSDWPSDLDRSRS